MKTKCCVLWKQNLDGAETRSIEDVQVDLVKVRYLGIVC